MQSIKKEYNKIEKNTASIYDRHNSNQCVLVMNQEIFKHGDELFVKYKNDFIEISRAGISSSKKSIKLMKLTNNTYTITLTKGIKKGNYEIDIIDNDTIIIDLGYNI